MPLKFGSLFSGIGGFDLGLEEAGMQCAWQCEIDRYANMVLARHWPETERFADVRTLHPAEPVPDVLCGGFPCQDLSVAGKRAGLAGEKSGLWWEFARVIDESVPEWVVIENVPGLLSSWSGNTPSEMGIDPGPGREMDLEETSCFGAVLGSLQEMGYLDIAWRVLDAQWFGVPQRRKRVFIVCRFGNGIDSAKVLFDPECLPWDSPPSLEAEPGIAGTLDSGTGERRGAGQNPSSLTVASTLSSGSNGNGRRREDDSNLIIGPLQSHSEKHGHAMTTQQAVEAGQVIAVHGHQNPVHSYGCALPVEVKGSQSIAYQCKGSGVGPMGTIKGDGVTRGVPFTERDLIVRRLTPLECERCQGFPDDWTRYDSDGNEISDSARYRLCGNAVVPAAAEWIGRRIVEVTI